ncbi:MAG TPA: hypothetical protein VNJ07_06325 [Chitinophagales bacterium]|nr:hypothetical protein [Chitinophagales bacterium]
MSLSALCFCMYIYNVKILVSILLLGLLAFQMFLKAGLVGYYYLDQSRIAATLCENRDKPFMHCKGKCYLKKQLKEADDSENNRQLPTSLQKLSEVQPFIGYELNSHLAAKGIAVEFAHMNFQLRPANTTGVLHPPGRQV